MRVFVGDDWAETHHDVHLMNDAGDRLAAKRFPEGLEGIAGLHALIAEHTTDPGEVIIGIETDRGMWVQALIAAGYRVYAINPLSVSRYRDRHNVAGAKSDPGDAKLLADLVRTDRHNHRPVPGDSDQAAGLKVLARAHQNLIWDRTRHTNRLRNDLREFFPAALVAFDSLADRDAVAVLTKAPHPDQARQLSIAQIRSALRKGGRQRNLDGRAVEIQQALRSPQLAAPPSVTAAFAATTKALIEVITGLNEAIAELETELATHLMNTRTPTSTSPCQDSVLCSAPGCSQSSGTTPTATTPPSLAGTTPARHRSPSPPARNTPCSPDMSATGASTTPLTSGHSAHCKPAPAAASSTTTDAPPVTSTTKHSER